MNKKIKKFISAGLCVSLLLTVTTSAFTQKAEAKADVKYPITAMLVGTLKSEGYIYSQYKMPYDDSTDPKNTKCLLRGSEIEVLKEGTQHKIKEDRYQKDNPQQVNQAGNNLNSSAKAQSSSESSKTSMTTVATTTTISTTSITTTTQLNSEGKLQLNAAIDAEEETEEETDTRYSNNDDSDAYTVSFSIKDYSDQYGSANNIDYLALQINNANQNSYPDMYVSIESISIDGKNVDLKSDPSEIYNGIGNDNLDLTRLVLVTFNERSSSNSSAAVIDPNQAINDDITVTFTVSGLDGDPVIETTTEATKPTQAQNNSVNYSSQGLFSANGANGANGFSSDSNSYTSSGSSGAYVSDSDDTDSMVESPSTGGNRTIGNILTLFVLCIGTILITLKAKKCKKLKKEKDK